MAASEEIPRAIEKLVSPAGEVRETTFAAQVREVLWIGWGLVFLGLIILGVAVALANFWTLPTGTCFPPGGGSSIPCPASELTTNDLAVVLALMLWSGVTVALGSILACLAWLRMPARA